MSENAQATSSQVYTEGQIRTTMERSRATLLSYLLKLNKCIDAQHNDLAQAIVSRFNEILIDYISYGHFRLLETCAPLAHQQAAIEKSTQQALQFSDRYTTRGELPLGKLKFDLEALVIALEVRFDIEDEVVAGVSA